jgi:predicted membrane-bound spermidine synthase
LPIFARGALRVPKAILGRALIYFPALGLGFLLIEIAFIEYAVLLLGDRTFGFALVLTVMLVCSGLGAMMVERVTKPAKTLTWIALMVVGSCLLAIGAAHTGILAILDWPWALRVAMLVLVLAPISIALGLPFPIDFSRKAPLCCPGPGR